MKTYSVMLKDGEEVKIQADSSENKSEAVEGHKAGTWLHLQRDGKCVAAFSWESIFGWCIIDSKP